MSRVRIGTCANPADAAFIRSMFAARGIDVVIAAEHHASLLGAIGSGFLSLDIWVAGSEAEEAAALLRDLRSGPGAQTDGDGADSAGDDSDGADTDGDDGPDRAAGPAGPDDTDDTDDAEDLQARIYRRRRTGLAFLLGACITFGTAHMVTGAWLRGLVLAALEIVGIRAVIHGERYGSLLIALSIIVDIAGALWRLHAAGRTQLPVARIRRS